MTYEEWEEKYKPIVNSLGENENTQLFETYGQEYEFIKKTDPKKIWTLVDGDIGTYIIDGWHYVNRIGYFVTEVPHDDEGIEVLDMLYGEDPPINALSDSEA